MADFRSRAFSIRELIHAAAANDHGARFLRLDHATLARAAGVATATAIAWARGRPVGHRTANRLRAALGLPLVAVARRSR